MTGTIDLFEPAGFHPCNRRLRGRQTGRSHVGREEDRGADRLTQMVVERALACAERMTAEGLSEPYRELTEPPASASRWRRRGTL